MSLIILIGTTGTPSLYYSLILLYKAYHHHQFLGSLAAEVAEGVEPRVVGLAEVQVEQPVVPAVHVEAGCCFFMIFLLSGFAQVEISSYLCTRNVNNQT